MPADDDLPGDNVTLRSTGFEIGIDELRLLPSKDKFRQLWTESLATVMLVSLMDDFGIDGDSVYFTKRLPVLFVKLRLELEGGPGLAQFLPVGGFAI